MCGLRVNICACARRDEALYACACMRVCIITRQMCTENKRALKLRKSSGTYGIQPFCSHDGNVLSLMVPNKDSSMKVSPQQGHHTHVHAIFWLSSMRCGRQLTRTLTPLCISPLQLHPSTKTASFMYCSNVAGALPRPANATTFPMKSGHPEGSGRGLKSAASQGCINWPLSQQAFSHQNVTAGYMHVW